ncbi:MAG: M28 family peptidase [Microscillaceae bacterium]|nr:M28 family peptidase [Microscillaceae bacterium]MDW8460813.1 M28 family peptidase [Cytophagales bacterium]
MLSCRENQPKREENTLSESNTSSTPPTPRPILSVPNFNADSAYYFIEAQVRIGKRVPNTEAHRKCSIFLVQTLQSLGWQVTMQDFDATAYDGTVLKSKNIIAAFQPERKKRILLAAHWDTRPFADKDTKDKNLPIDGANDGGSGVGVLLEIARIISQSTQKPAVGIDIIFFDSEDYGQPEDFKGEYKPDMWCLGSQYWAKNKHKENYSAYYGILLDMVGAKGAKFYREGLSKKYAPSIVEKVWNTARQLGYTHFFVPNDSPEITDDHKYINEIAKIPMINIVEYNPNTKDSYFADYHHTHNDNMQLIDKQTLKAVGQTVLHVLYQEGEHLQ